MSLTELLFSYETTLSVTESCLIHELLICLDLVLSDLEIKTVSMSKNQKL